MTTSERLNSRPPGEGTGDVCLSKCDAEDLFRLLRIVSRGLKENSLSTIDRAEFARVARVTLQRRRERLELFPTHILGEPAWDMLVELYANGHRFDADPGKLAEVSGVQVSSAKRWIASLEQSGLLVRQVDQGIESIRLTSKAIRALDCYFCQILTASDEWL